MNLIERIVISVCLSASLGISVCRTKVDVANAEGHLQKKPRGRPALPAGSACSDESLSPHSGNELEVRR